MDQKCGMFKYVAPEHRSKLDDMIEYHVKNTMSGLDDIHVTLYRVRDGLQIGVSLYEVNDKTNAMQWLITKAKSIAESDDNIIIVRSTVYLAIEVSGSNDIVYALEMFGTREKNSKEDEWEI